jgi:hypothetical protein
LSNLKDNLCDLGLVLLDDWLTDNPRIIRPQLEISRDKNDRLSKTIEGFATCGFYRNNVIHMSVPLCANPNQMYSWPGYISDRTPYGVIQHELGHHVDQMMSGTNIYRTRAGGFFSDRIREKSGEKPITSYSPNNMEWFAEIFRLFVTNPFLLAMIRPRAYDALVDSGLNPTVDASNVEVLTEFSAPKRIFERMDKWLTDKTK